MSESRASSLSPPHLSVVICTYNREAYLRDALESVARQDVLGEIAYDLIVVDDASTDGTRDVIAEFSARAPFPVTIVHELGGGIGKARNRGVAAVRGLWVAFMDDDEIAAPDWLRQLLRCAHEKSAAVVGGVVHLKLDPWRLSRLPVSCRRLLGESELPEDDRAFLCDPRNVPGAGNLLIMRQVIELHRGFDESLASAGEDLEFVLRLMKAGVRVWRTPLAVVEHQIPAYRLRSDFLRWSSLRVGENFARRDWARAGIVGAFPLAIARTAQAALIHAPLLALAKATGNAKETLHRRALLWRWRGYVERAFASSGQLSHMQDTLNFRKERERFRPGADAQEGEAMAIDGYQTPGNFALWYEALGISIRAMRHSPLQSLGAKKIVGKLLQPINSPTRYPEYRAYFEMLEPLLRTGAVRNALDISSPKLFTLMLATRAPIRIHAADPFAPAIEEARAMAMGIDEEARERIEFGDETASADFRARKPGSEPFDLIYAMSVIEHIEPEEGGDAAAIRSLIGQLRPGGHILISMPVAANAFIHRLPGEVYGRTSANGELVFFQRVYSMAQVAELMRKFEDQLEIVESRAIGWPGGERFFRAIHSRLFAPKAAFGWLFPLAARAFSSTRHLNTLPGPVEGYGDVAILLRRK